MPQALRLQRDPWPLAPGAPWLCALRATLRGQGGAPRGAAAGLRSALAAERPRAPPGDGRRVLSEWPQADAQWQVDEH